MNIYIYVTLHAIGCERNSFLKNKLEAFFQRSPHGKMFLITMCFSYFSHCSRSGRGRSIVISKWRNKIGEKSLIKLNVWRWKLTLFSLLNHWRANLCRIGKWNTLINHLNKNLNVFYLKFLIFSQFLWNKKIWFCYNNRYCQIY